MRGQFWGIRTACALGLGPSSLLPPSDERDTFLTRVLSSSSGLNEHSKLQGVYVQRRPTWRAQTSWNSRFRSALLPTPTMVDRSPDLAPPHQVRKLIFDAHVRVQARAPSARRAYSCPLFLGILANAVIAYGLGDPPRIKGARIFALPYQHPHRLLTAFEDSPIHLNRPRKHLTRTLHNHV